MAKYNKQLALFKEISRKKVEIDFNGGTLTSDAGLLILAKVASRLGIFNKLADCITDHRHSSYTKHSIYDLFRQRIFQICAHYEDANDSDHLRHDPTMKLLCDRLPESDADLASQPTISRFENSPNRQDLYRIGQMFVELFIQSYQKPPRSIILDLDETEDTVHGEQQLSLFNNYYRSDCYLPLHIYEGNSGKLISAILRPGRRPSGKEVAMYLKRLIPRLRTAWPKVRILLRADANYCTPEVFDLCYKYKIQFILGLTPRSPQWEKAQPTINRAERLLKKSQWVKTYGQFNHQAKTWSRPVRIIVKVEKSEHQQSVRFIATNLKQNDCRRLYQSVYCGRGRAEGFIKEHKLHLASDRTSCSTFEANQLRLFLHSAAYVILQDFRASLLKGSEYAHAQFNTIQLKLFKISARIKEMRTKVKIHFCSTYPDQRLYRLAWNSA